MEYTKFGEQFKILRIRHHEVLADAKEFLGVSSAFISAVECGKKPIPEGWLTKIADHYDLSEKEIEELRESIELSKPSIKIDILNATNVKKQVAMQFQRSFDEIDEETAQQIMTILRRNEK